MATESKEFMIHASEGNSNVLDFTPAIDILENDQEVVLVADVPGTTAERVTSSVLRYRAFWKRTLRFQPRPRS